MTSALQKILDKRGVGLLSGPVHSDAWEDVALVSCAEDSADQFSLSWGVVVSVRSLHRDDLHKSQQCQRLCGPLGLCIRLCEMGTPT